MKHNGKDTKHLARVRTLPCLFEGPECDGPMDAHHRTGSGLALKSNDRSTMPLCRAHHMHRHQLSGPFKGKDKMWIKAWELEAVARTLALLESPEGF